MSPKITPEHLDRGAVVYVRQSTMGQVTGNLESQLRQYGLIDTAKAAGFVSVTVIDDDLGRSGSGVSERPGFQRLVATVCASAVGAVFCIEASRLARNGRDWHHLIDLCALTGVLVIDPDGAYDPRLMNDRLLLGLKGTMSEYELSLLRQRGIAARDAKAARGELRFMLPPGYCWTEAGRIEMDPDEHVGDAIRLLFRKFRELGSARQVFLWARDAKVRMPVVLRNTATYRIQWRAPAYHTVLQVLQNPIYAGAYAYGRRSQRTRVVDGRARKTSGLVRCGRCGRMMRVFYGMRSGRCHRYQCRGDDAHVGAGLCIGIGGLRIDRAVAALIMEAVSDRAVEAAILAADQVAKADEDVRMAVKRELDEARYGASLAARRHELVDPEKRHVARELEARWNTALERVSLIEQRITRLHADVAQRPKVDRAALMRLAHDLPTMWNAPTADTRTKQRLIRTLIHEVMIDLDDSANEAVVTVHWVGGRHTEVRVQRTKTGRYPADRQPSPVDVMQKLGGQWPDRDLAVTMNRMRCKRADGETWTTVRVQELRERLGIAAFDAATQGAETISVDETAHRLGICVGSVHKLIREGALPATQLMHSAPWKVPVEALETETLKIGLQAIIARRPRRAIDSQRKNTLQLPGL